MSRAEKQKELSHQPKDGTESDCELKKTALKEDGRYRRGIRQVVRSEERGGLGAEC